MSKIEWTEKTWNPIVGCSKVSPGCDHCYAERMAIRLCGMECARAYGKTKYINVVTRDKKTHGWTGQTWFDESALQIPLKRKKATTYFVCSMGDLFHESVPFDFIDKVFAVMALCHEHTFQVLTKRPERMAEYLGDIRRVVRIAAAASAGSGMAIDLGRFWGSTDWPLPNVWLGTTAENQEMADKRIPELLKCPAAKRFVSVEPMLGAVDLCSLIEIRQFQGDGKGWPTEKRPVKINAMHGYGIESPYDDEHGKPIYYQAPTETVPKLDWVICGGESGPGARPMHPDWARSLRDQCKAAGVPFFFKQWGKWLPGSQANHISDARLSKYKFQNLRPVGGQCFTFNVGKKKAGSLLDGVEHKGMPND